MKPSLPPSLLAPLSSCKAVSEYCPAGRYFRPGFRRSKSSSIASPITTAAAPIPIPAFALTDNPGPDVCCGVSDTPAVPVAVARLFEGEVADANRSELRQFIWINGA